MSTDNDYILENIKNEHSFIKDLDYYKLYEEFNKSCNNIFGNDACYNRTTDGWPKTHDVIELLKDIHGNLYKIYATLNGDRSEYFDDFNPDNDKICCVSLKYWLYDKIVTKNLNDAQIKELYEGWKNHIHPKAEYHRFQPCIFHNLNKDEINSIKNIYALTTILQSTREIFENCNEKVCKYKDYFEQGLIEFINSANKCSGDSRLEGYCAEFRDFLNICHDNQENKGIRLSANYYVPSVDDGMRYLLSVKNKENQALYVYIKDNKWLNWDKIYDILNTQKRTTIAPTSIAGSAIGLSSIFYYLYKVNLDPI
ncbi:hypothetical protein PVNG_05823 [Plasmodium vivax North Korean]|uniref:Variable surface protein Vir24g n=1 Tax=Plasmodium vivax North Korean TaxID=1035514 RepID=A0A0J9TXZ9_PLAVI|nr:hypothetical protein PVNG_05823 [Plasmodium vivax North Korean]